MRKHEGAARRRSTRELNYRPDIHAQALAGRKSRTLGLVVSNLQNPFFLDIFQVMESDAKRHGYEVVVANTDYHPRQLASSVHWMLGHRLAGLAVIVSEKEPSIIQELAGGTVPVVFYDVGAPGPNVTNIRTDYFRGTQRVVEYLYSLGHRRMAFVGHHEQLQPLYDRKKSFLGAVGRLSSEITSATAAGGDSPDGARADRQGLDGAGSPDAGAARHAVGGGAEASPPATPVTPWGGSRGRALTSSPGRPSWARCAPSSRPAA